MVRGPGKFENCPVYAPHYYDAMMNGFVDGSAGDEFFSTDMFIVSDEDRAMFPELHDPTDECVTISVDDQGFVECNTCTKYEWKRFEESYMSKDDLDYRHGMRI